MNQPLGYSGKAALFAAAFVLLSGVLVYAAWIAGVPEFTRLLPESSLVQPNSGLLFAVLASGVLASLARRRALATTCAAVAALVAGLTLVEYVADVDVGIDDFFAGDGERMAPNTTVTFLVSALALFAGSARARWAGGLAPVLGALVLALGAVPLLGYAVGLAEAIQWAGLRRMALLTATNFVVLGAALMLPAARLRGRAGWSQMPRHAASAGVALAAISVLSWYALREAPAAAQAHVADIVLGLGLTAAMLLAGALAQAGHRQLQAQQLRRANLLLRASADEIRDLYDRAPCGYHSLDPDGVFMRINRTELEWLGYASGELIGRKRITDVVTPASRAVVLEAFPRFKREGVIQNVELEMVRKDGSVLPVLLNATAVHDDSGAFLHSRSTVFDITDRKRADEALRESERRLQALVDTLEVAVVVHGADTAIQFANPAAAAILGLTREQLLGKTTIDPRWHFVREDGAPMPVAEYPVSLVAQRRQALRDYVVGVRDAPGRPARWVLVNAIPDIGDDGKLRQVIVSFVDISERTHKTQQLERIALTDSLTGLATRRHFLAEAEREVSRAQRGHPLSLLVFDVDHFKAINDTHGHGAGDRALAGLGQAALAVLRGSDLAGRLGGEEFGVLLPDADQALATAVAERLRAAAAGVTVSLDQGGELRFTVSVGAATLHGADAGATELIARADAAMYEAKRAGRNRVQAADWGQTPNS